MFLTVTEVVSPELHQSGALLQAGLILAALVWAGSMVLGHRNLTGALACLALSFVGMAMRGEPAAIIAIATAVLMEIRLKPRLRHRGLLEWLLVALALSQTALLMTLALSPIFWVAQAMGALTLMLSLLATFAPHVIHPVPVAAPRTGHLIPPTDPHR